jgi:16S rRNA (cytosine1402-N4)-methyltransferase
MTRPGRPRSRGPRRPAREPDAPDLAGGYHEPVLVEEALRYLSPAGGELYLDGTVGGGGHALLLLSRCPDCRLVAVDRDPDALAEAGATLSAHAGRVRFLHATFDRAAADPEIRAEGLAGALLDLGVSSHQIDRAERGFSFARGAGLDMRMGGDEGGPTAADLLNEESEERLAQVFREYAEEPRARRLAREIVRRRENRPFETSDDLVAALAATLGRAPSNRDKARIFQGLRVALNAELELLERALPDLRDVLKPRGVIVVIAYHSLEDRIVKDAFREWSQECICPPELPVCRCRGHALGETLTRKPVVPTEEETRKNPRARSARLRAWRKAA